MKRAALTLTESEQLATEKLLDQIRAEIANLAHGDPSTSFRIRRYVHARLQKDGRPPRALQRSKFKEQEGRCAECRRPFAELKGLPLHRTTPDPYSSENTLLVHPACHTLIHQRGDAPPD